MPESITVIIRAIISFFSLLIFTRLLGKQQISQLSFFDYITGITIGSMAASLTTDLSSRAIAHWWGIAAWTGFAFGLQILTSKVRWWGKIVDGEPTVVVHNGMIMERNMDRMNFKLTDLMEELRRKNVFNITDVEFAVLETDGKLSVQKKSQFEPITPNDLNISTSYKGIQTELITEGVILHQNLEQLHITQDWLLGELQKRGITDLNEVFYASLYTDGTLYVDTKEDRLVDETNMSDYEGPN